MTALPTDAQIEYQANEPAGPWVAAIFTFFKCFKESLGVVPAEPVSIVSGILTPVSGATLVDTEASTSTDDLSNIVTTNIPDGRWLMLRPVSAARVVTVKHMAGGAGQIQLLNGADYVMDAIEDFLILERVGSDWRELCRRTETASTDGPGVVELATPAETQTGTDAQRAVTPVGAAATYTPKGRQIAAGAGLSGGGDLSSNRSLALDTTHGNDWTGQQAFAEQALTDAATISWNLATQQCARVTLAGNRTLSNPTNMKAGGTYVLRVVQDATGGRTLTFGTAYLFPGGTDPTVTATAGAVTLLCFYCDGTNMLGNALLDVK